MRIAAFCLMLACGTASAATLEVTVTEKLSSPVKYSYELNGTKHKLDLRDAHRYQVAVHDEVRKKDICRDAEYRTGLMMTFNDVNTRSTQEYIIEVVGQISSLDEVEITDRLACGPNQAPKLVHRAFSDTSAIKPGKSKVIVIDGDTTLLLSVTD